MISSNQPRRSSSRAPQAGADGHPAGLPPWKDQHSFQRPHWDSSSPPSHYRSTGSLSFPKPSWFHSSESLLQKEHQNQPRSTDGGSERKLWQRSSRLHQRRGSEPVQQVSCSGVARARLPSDPGLKATGVQAEARFCLSPCASKAVRDYFSTYPCSHPHGGQQVALALVESHSQWLKRCNDPTAEPDFEQLLFAEESYV